ncbi:hypothetical protein BV898_15263 [Hypsibius exemplaris]|uniref:Uncharacterized protein n=1 Tax=Hypsibius exemplaris TaxID=2072580 RepID=A0A9X6NAN1_HYPEX|nr:hypothetical protein BV898_15263 [Hypsibius exemplaris]
MPHNCGKVECQFQMVYVKYKPSHVGNSVLHFYGKNQMAKMTSFKPYGRPPTQAEPKKTEPSADRRPKQNRRRRNRQPTTDPSGTGEDGTVGRPPTQAEPEKTEPSSFDIVV